MARTDEDRNRLRRLVQGEDWGTLGDNAAVGGLK